MKTCHKKLDRWKGHFGHWIGNKFVPCKALHPINSLETFKQMFRRELAKVQQQNLFKEKEDGKQARLFPAR